MTPDRRCLWMVYNLRFEFISTVQILRSSRRLRPPTAASAHTGSPASWMLDLPDELDATGTYRRLCVGRGTAALGALVLHSGAQGPRCPPHGGAVIYLNPLALGSSGYESCTRGWGGGGVEIGHRLGAAPKRSCPLIFRHPCPSRTSFDPFRRSPRDTSHLRTSFILYEIETTSSKMQCIP